LGYHYGFLGHPTEARAELAEAVKLEDRDEIAARLLEQFGGKASRPKRERGEDAEMRRGGRGVDREAPREQRERRELEELPDGGSREKRESALPAPHPE
jgi:hypothetical protein